MQSASYLCRNSYGVYYARFVVPVCVHGQRRELRLSTFSKDPRTAASVARRLRVTFEDGLNAVRANALTYDAMVHSLKAQMSRIKPPPPGTPTYNIGQDDRGRWQITDVKPGDDLLSAAEFIRSMEASVGGTPIATAAVSPPMPPATLAPASAPTQELLQPGQLSAVASRPIGEMVEEYLQSETQRAERGDIGVKNVPAQRAKLAVFVEYCGAAMKVGAVSPQFVANYRDDLLFFPANKDKAKQTRDVGVKTLIEWGRSGTLVDTAGNQVPMLSTATVEGYIVALMNFLRYCEGHLAVHSQVRAHLLAPKSRTKGKGGTKGSIKRKPFSNSDMKRLFESEYLAEGRYNRSYQYWVPLLGAFTGARLNELCQLSPSDVMQWDDVWCIRITDVAEDEGEAKSLKTEGSRRMIPVHDQLVRLGFLEFVDKQRVKGAKNLFELNAAKADGYGKVPGEWFNQKYLRKMVGIYEASKVFHSFRHGFVTRLSEAIIEASPGVRRTRELDADDYPEAKVLRKLAVHSQAHAFTAGQGHMDTHTETYFGDVKPELLARVINRLAFPDVTFRPYIEPEESTKKRKAARPPKGELGKLPEGIFLA